MALRCYKGTVLSINAPVTTSPAHNGNFSNNSALTLKWNTVTAASNYRVSLRDQSNNVFIDPVTGSNTSNQFGASLNATTFTLSSAAIARMAGSGRNKNNNQDCGQYTPYRKF